MRKQICPLLALIPLAACTSVSPLGQASLVVKPVVEYRTQGEVKPCVKSDINHLLLKLCDTSDHEMGINLDIPQSELDCPVVFNNLRMNTTYRVRAYAYADAGTGHCISVDASSYVDIGVGNDDRPYVENVKVKLLDTSFAAEGSSSVAITPGSLYCNDPMQMQFINRGIVTTLAGNGDRFTFKDGTGTAATFCWPASLATDASGNLFVADGGNHRIRKVTPAGCVSTFAGNGSYSPFADGTGTAANFYYPHGLTFDQSGNLFVTDTDHGCIRKITPAGVVTTAIAAHYGPPIIDGYVTFASYGTPRGILVDADNNIYFGDSGNHLIRKFTPSLFMSTVAGIIVNYQSTSGYRDGWAGQALFNQPFALAWDQQGNIYISDRLNHAIRKLTPSGYVSTLAGNGVAGYADGTGTQAAFREPDGIAVDQFGTLYVADAGNNCIRKITPEGVVSTFAGNGVAGFGNGTGTNARFNYPNGIAIDKSGTIYVSDCCNHRIRVIR